LPMRKDLVARISRSSWRGVDMKIYDSRKEVLGSQFSVLRKSRGPRLRTENWELTTY